MEKQSIAEIIAKGEQNRGLAKPTQRRKPAAGKSGRPAAPDVLGSLMAGAFSSLESAPAQTSLTERYADVRDGGRRVSEATDGASAAPGAMASSTEMRDAELEFRATHCLGSKVVDLSGVHYDMSRYVEKYTAMANDEDGAAAEDERLKQAAVENVVQEVRSGGQVYIAPGC